MSGWGGVERCGLVILKIEGVATLRYPQSDYILNYINTPSRSRTMLYSESTITNLNLIVLVLSLAFVLSWQFCCVSPNRTDQSLSVSANRARTIFFMLRY